MESNTHFDFDIQRASSLPVYLQFKEQLKANIRRKKLAPGTRLPNIDVLAGGANIGVKTAYKGISELIKERVCFKRPKNGTFVAGERMNGITTKKICCVYHNVSMNDIEKNMMLGPIYRGMQEKASQCGVDMFFLTGDPVDSLEFYLENDKIDLTGVIMLEWDCYKEGVRLAEIFPEIRFVYLNYHSEKFDATPKNVYGVFNDDFSGAFQAGEYLAQAGHKLLAVLSVELVEDNYRKRVDGFKLALEDNGYDLDTQLLEIKEAFDINSDKDLRPAGYKLARKAYSKGQTPTALFVINDLIAEGALNYLKEHGLADKVELFGFDNIFPEISRDNNFSTVAVDFIRMGARAIDIIAGTESYCSKSMLLNPQLLIRKHNS